MRFPVPPSWYEIPEVQIKTISEFLRQNGNEVGFTADDIPIPPNDFVAITPTEALMLSVTLPASGDVKMIQRNFDSKWNFIIPPNGSSKWRWVELKSDEYHLRYAKGNHKTPGIRWVGFDPEAYVGLSSDQALAQKLEKGITVGGDEILDAAIVFPRWPTFWKSHGWHAPNMSAYQVKDGPEWRLSPWLCYWGSELSLAANASGRTLEGRSSAAIREL